MQSFERRMRTAVSDMAGVTHPCINQRNMTVLPNGVVQAIARAQNSSPLFVSVRDLLQVPM